MLRLILNRGQPQEKIEAVRELTKNEKNLWRVSSYAVRAKSKLDDAAIIAAQRVGEYTNRDAHYRLFETIANLASNNPEVWDQIFSIVGTNRALNNELAYQIFVAKINNPAVSGWALKNIKASPGDAGYFRGLIPPGSPAKVPPKSPK